ncbi:ankyrin repeat domain-containing protein [Thermosulfurimonas dismutans]|uniref:Ankyrin repeat protein n=1 Tax=Thermosulfurimonas dismutans TaxID=999894 RepID=A0A179D155_9BACT|nr:ankyrin repeat domain-containing protein [Thermosulfurimonas dismutans]OAQ19780.1 Ankyrin repeat protein [Thermosulfurimonas dismutans]
MRKYRDVDLKKAIFIAVGTGKVKDFVQLLEKVKLSQKDKNDLLYLAAMKGNALMVSLLLGEGAHVKARSEDGITPLHCAAKRGDADVVKILLEHGADVNARDKKGDTPLHRAAWEGNTEVVKVLLEYGADVNARSKISKKLPGHTPLLWSCSKRSCRCSEGAS